MKMFFGKVKNADESLLRRHLHTLFTDNPTNVTEDHYHRPDAGSYYIPDEQSSSEEESSNNLNPLHDNQTLTFTLIFLASMILYIGFCFHYRKVKIINWRINSSNNTNEGEANRTRRQRTNQAVLDESTSAANRAAGDESEERKLEVRRGRIEEVLWTRLIVDCEEKELGKCGEVEEEQGERGVAQDEVKGVMVDEEQGAAVPTVKQEEKEGQGGDAATVIEETTIATVPSSSEGTVLSNKEQESATATAVTTSPFRKYTNALSCNTCNNQTPSTTKLHPPSPTTETITLLQIHQTYGEECNICLSPFQLGDRAAWSKNHFNGCVHVFHEECMKRWLLVRDGCPICRRAFLEVKSGGGDLESGGNDVIVAAEEE